MKLYPVGASSGALSSKEAPVAFASEDWLPPGDTKVAGELRIGSSDEAVLGSSDDVSIGELLQQLEFEA